LTDAALGNHPGIKGTPVALLPPDSQLLSARVDGQRAPAHGAMAERVLTGPDGRETARLMVYHEGSHDETARRALLFFAAAGVLLAVGVYAVVAGEKRDEMGREET
jgi:hypothetical protein